MLSEDKKYKIIENMKYKKYFNLNKIEKDLLRQIPTMWLTHAHHWLILHGRYICKARKPECFKCPIRHLCEYKSKNL